jgi:hypothetical protein
LDGQPLLQTVSLTVPSKEETIMGILSKDALLAASDLTEREVDLTPHVDGSVRVRSLPAAYANQAVSEAMEMTTSTSGAQTARVNSARLEELQVLHGLIEPKLDSLDEVQRFSRQCGRAWQKIVRTIQDISGVDEKAVDRTNAMFQSGGQSPAGLSTSNGTGTGSDGSDQHARAGADAAHAGGGDVPADVSA